MNVVSKYETMVVQYDDSYEMREHMNKMQDDNWIITNLSYRNLNVRYRKGVKGA